jgi:uncharacterized protein (TIGR03118 family)
MAAVLATAVAVLATGTSSAAERNAYVQHNLVSDGTIAADHTDGQLVNAWGLTSLPGSPWWVADNETSVSTLYGADGTKRALVVDVPNNPTGAASNTSSNFVVGSGPALFLFSTEEGKVLAWNMSVGTTAQVVADKSGDGAIFKGLAIAGDRLYATDFHNARVLVYDSHWRRVLRRGAFVDRAIPSWYAPFGIQAVGRRIFVTYAWRAPVNGNDAPKGGYVDEFDLDGRLVARVGHSKQLDEPWGVALAPRGFGRFGGDLLVANFGTGLINAYARDGRGWKLDGRLPVKAPGVWGIAFGNGAHSGPRTTLFYAAGPHRWHGATEVDVHGVLGAIAPG